MVVDLRFVDYFLFTQYSLTTFENCPLKFKKRYLEGLKWDSFPDPEVKRRLEMGNDFHMLAYRYFMGVDTGLEKASEPNDELSKWIQCLKSCFKPVPFVRYFPEYKLRMVEGNLKLEANFDLLMVKEDSIQIWDWKTHGSTSKHKAGVLEKKLRESLQTLVYLFVLKEQASLLMGRELECSKISMHYWQPDPPGVVTEIRYSDKMHEDFLGALENRIKNILEYDYAQFDKALYSRHCKFCEFNWFCNNERVDFQAVLDEGDGLLEELGWDDVEARY